MARKLEPACAMMASDLKKYWHKAFSVICMGKTNILEFKKNGKANIKVLALDLFLTVLPLKKETEDSSVKLVNSRAESCGSCC